MASVDRERKVGILVLAGLVAGLGALKLVTDFFLEDAGIVSSVASVRKVVQEDLEKPRPLGVEVHSEPASSGGDDDDSAKAGEPSFGKSDEASAMSDLGEGLDDGGSGSEEQDKDRAKEIDHDKRCLTSLFPHDDYKIWLAERLLNQFYSRDDVHDHQNALLGFYSEQKDFLSKDRIIDQDTQLAWYYLHAIFSRLRALLLSEGVLENDDSDGNIPPLQVKAVQVVKQESLGAFNFFLVDRGLSSGEIKDFPQALSQIALRPIFRDLTDLEKIDLRDYLLELVNQYRQEYMQSTQGEESDLADLSHEMWEVRIRAFDEAERAVWELVR